MRIMTPKLLEKFSKAIRNFTDGLFYNDTFTSVKEIDKLLNVYKLNGKQIIQEYTIKYKL